jgi:hypothetical protein
VLLFRISGADPSVPEALLENMDKLGKVVRRIRADVELEKSRKDREGEDLRDVCGDTVCFKISSSRLFIFQHSHFVCV